MSNQEKQQILNSICSKMLVNCQNSIYTPHWEAQINIFSLACAHQMITASLTLRHRLHLLHLDTRRNTLSGQLRRLLNTHEGRTRVRIRASRCEINFWFVVVGSISTRKAILCAERLFIQLLNRQQKEKEEGRRSARLVSIIQLHFTFRLSFSLLSLRPSCAKSWAEGCLEMKSRGVELERS